jgi:hypothetical protein
MESNNMSDILRVWLNNKFIREAEVHTRLSEENVDKRKRVDQLTENDRKLLDSINSRLTNQDKNNKEC